VQSARKQSLRAPVDLSIGFSYTSYNWNTVVGWNLGEETVDWVESNFDEDTARQCEGLYLLFMHT